MELQETLSVCQYAAWKAGNVGFDDPLLPTTISVKEFDSKETHQATTVDAFFIFPILHQLS